MTEDPYNELVEDENNLKIRAASGAINDDRKVVAFLYRLMRDHLPTTVVEEIVRDINRSSSDGFMFSNGWLAQYSQFIANRLEEDPSLASPVPLDQKGERLSLGDKVLFHKNGNPIFSKVVSFHEDSDGAFTVYVDDGFAEHERWDYELLKVPF